MASLLGSLPVAVHAKRKTTDVVLAEQPSPKRARAHDPSHDPSKDDFEIPATPDAPEDIEQETASPVELAATTPADVPSSEKLHGAPPLYATGRLNELLDVVYHFGGKIVGDGVRRHIMGADEYDQLVPIEIVMSAQSRDYFRAYVQVSAWLCTFNVEARALVVIHGDWAPIPRLCIFADESHIPYDLDINLLTFDGTVVGRRSGVENSMSAIFRHILHREMEIVDVAGQPWNCERATAVATVIETQKRRKWLLLDARSITIYTRRSN
jgi:hypothetical protein